MSPTARAFAHSVGSSGLQVVDPKAGRTALDDIDSVRGKWPIAFTSLSRKPLKLQFKIEISDVDQIVN
jgi:hypothetical protein